MIRRPYQRVGTSPRTGIWHETYLVRAGEYEAIYGNMPPFGLGAGAARPADPGDQRGRSATAVAEPPVPAPGRGKAGRV